MSYSAPVADLRFVMSELAGLPALAELPGFEEATPDLVEAILEEGAKMAQEVLAPINRTGDEQRARLEGDAVKPADGFKQAWEQFRDAGWASLSHPVEYGGQGLPFVLQAACAEMWDAANMAFGLFPMLTASGIESLFAHADEKQKAAFLPKMISGEWAGTMCLTEPQAGSDLAAIRCQAEANGDHYLLRGTKIFITWGDHDMTDNILHLVLARLPDAPEGVKGISLFIVPKFVPDEDGNPGKRNDVFPVSLEHKLGIHASPTCVMAFGEKEGAEAYLVGQPHQGLRYMFTMMNHARIEVGVQGTGIADRAMQRAAAYARERVQGNTDWGSERVTIIHHPDVRRMLMTMRALVEAARAVGLVGSAAHDVATHHPDEAVARKARSRVDFLTPVIKGWCTEIAQEVASLAIQVHGGMGYIEETGAAQHFRDARISPIYEGTNGIQAADLIGRKLLRDGGGAWSTLRDEIAQTLDQISKGDDDLSVRLAAPVSVALNDLDASCQHILSNAKTDAALAGAAAFPLLMQTGTTLGGWLMLKSAAACAGSDSVWGSEFCDNKRATARFYIEHILPRAAGCKAAILAGSESLMSIPESAF